MSRRESRVSLGAKQNDALFEFENFKKKFLLANKHITKLNSTLSVRIEELNAQISSLYVENLRLRASEIALAAQLKREREKTQKVMAEAETATLSLTKHLGYIRQSFNIPVDLPTPISPQSPRARKPPPNPNTSPTMAQTNRISRPPNVPGIYEDEEPCPSTSEDEPSKSHSPTLRKMKAHPRLSLSRLPLPSRATSPPLPSHTSGIAVVAISATKSRKQPRRQSGLLAIDTESLSVPRAPSPAFGSPIRREAGLAEEEEELAAVAEQLQVATMDVDMIVEVRASPRKARRKSRGKDPELAEGQDLVEETSRPRERKRTKEKMQEAIDGGAKPHLKEVTNSRAALLPIDNTLHDEPDTSSGRAPGTSPTPSAPTSRSSSSPAPPIDGDGFPGGRERRVRKSVNYTEPKLNTKMRKPDPQPGAEQKKKRASAAAVLTTRRLVEDSGNDADNDTEARSSLELPLRINGNPINPESFPLPPSRPTSSLLLSSPPPAALHASPSSSSARTSVKRKKSRPQLLLDEEESDGAEADAEYGVGSGWVNLENRRRGNAGNGKRTVTAADDPRRHSMAV